MPKISQYPSMTPLTGPEVFIGDQAGITSIATAAQFVGLAAQTLADKSYAFVSTDTGAANAYVLTAVNPALVLVPGIRVLFIPANNNTGASTATWNGSAAKAILGLDSQPLKGGELSSLGPTELLYNGTTFQVITTAATVRTPAEIAAGVTVVNYNITAGVVDRYLSNSNPGTTDMTVAFSRALAQQQQTGGAPIQLLAETYLVTSNAVKLQGGVVAHTIPLVMFGVPRMSAIVNKAPANTPTIQLIDKFTFDIRGIVFAGRAGFPNVGIDLNSAIYGPTAGSRTGFGVIKDVDCNTNGVGIHIAGCNDIQIGNFTYWPNGSGGLPGAATNDGANALPAGILSDNVGIAGFNPGQSNAVYVNGIQVGTCNAIGATPSGAGIRIDGSANLTGPAGAQTSNADWRIENYDSGACQRTLWASNTYVSSYSHIYSGGNILFDQACARSELKHLYGNSVTMDGTKSLGGCDQMKFTNCFASTFAADVANSFSYHDSCDWTVSEADLSVGMSRTNGRVAGAKAPDLIGSFGLAIGNNNSAANSLGNGSTIVSNGFAVQRITNGGAVTGIILAKPTNPSANSLPTLTLINVGAGSVTFAASGTSNVADGVACVIPVNRQMTFVFDITSQLWNH